MTDPGSSIAASVVRHGGTYAAARLAQRALALLMVPVYAHYLAPAGYGVVALLASIEPLVLMFFSQGLLAAWVRMRFECRNDADRIRFESTIFWYLILTSAVLLAAVVGFGDRVVDWLAPDTPFRPLLFLAFVNAAVRLVSELYLRRLQAEGASAAFARFTLLRALATMAAVAFFVVVLERGPEGKLIGEIGVVTFFTAIAFTMMKPAWVFDWKWLRASLTYGLPLLPHTLMTSMQGAVSRVLITYYLGVAATGVFAMGVAIANLGSLVAMALNQAYQPLFYRAVKDLRSQESDRTVSTDVGRAGCTIVCSVAVVCLLLTAGARELLGLVTTPEFDRAWQMVAPVAASVVLQAAYFVFSQSVLYEASGSRRIVWASGLSVAVNALVNVALLPLLGIAAAALALIAANATLAGVAYRLGQERVRIAYSRPRWLGALGVSCLALAALFLADLRIEAWLPRVAIKLSVVAACVPALARIAGMSLRWSSLGLDSVREPIVDAAEL